MATPTSLPASFSDSTSLPAASLNSLRGAFRVLQLFSASTTTQVTSTSTAYADIGLSVTITPTATTNKILLIAATSGYANNFSAAIGIRFLRDATDVFTSRQANLVAFSGMSFTSIYLDSPSSTSAITYKVQGARQFGSGTILFQESAAATSTFLVCEISA